MPANKLIISLCKGFYSYLGKRLKNPHFLSMVRRLAEIVLVAIFYYLTARLGFSLALPPGNVTILWPPSGLALASVILWGWPMGAGIFAGAFLVNLGTVSGANSLPVAAAIATGSTLQALLGAWLLQRFIKPLPPETIRHTLLVIVITSVVTLLAPAVGVTSLCLAGTAPWHNYGTLLWTWWLGDFIGILVFAPPLIIWLKNNRKQNTREPYLWPITCSIIGLALFAFVLIRNIEQQKVLERQQRDAIEMADVLQNAINHEIYALTAIRAFYGSSQEVNREEFSSFTASLLSNSPETSGLEWVRRTTQAERPGFEQSFRELGYADFSIYEKDAAGNNIPVAIRAEYFPVTLIEPFTPNQAAFGFDLGSNQERLSAINRARDSGEPTTTGPIHLVQETGNQIGILIMMPIYLNGARTDTLESRRANLQGLAIGVYRIGILAVNALKDITRHDIELYIYDISEASNPQFLAFYPSITGAQSLPESGPPTPSAIQIGMIQTETWQIGGRDWMIVARPGPAYEHYSNEWAAWVSLLVGFVLAGTFLTYVASRQRTEAALTRSEAQFRTLFENIPMSGVIYRLILDEQNEIVDWELHEINEAGAADIHQSPSELIGKRASDLFGAEVMKPYLEQCRTVVASGQAQQIETHFSHNDKYYLTALFTIGTDFYANVSIDVTESKQAEQALRESEARYKSLFENNQAVMLIIDPDSAYIVDANAAATEYYGWSREELLKKKISQINTLTPDEINNALQESKAQNRNHFFFKHCRADGSIRDVEVYSGPLVLAGKHLLYSIIHDIAERKLAEEQLRASNERFSQLANNIQEVFWMFDLAAQKISYISPAYEIIWGRTCASLYQDSREYYQSILPEDQPIMIDALEKQAQGQRTEIEYRIQKPDGSVRWVWDRSFPIFDKKGILTTNAGVATDITEIKTTQRELEALNSELEERVEERTAQVRQSETTYRALFENSNDGIFLISPEGVELQANHQALDILGYTQEEWNTINNNQLVPFDQQQNADENFQAAVRGEYVPLYERTLLTKDGKKIETEINLSAVRDASGKAILVQGVVRDITERKKAEEALRSNRDKLSAANAALEKASRLKDEFLASMSHELRTPLTGVLGLAEVLQLQTHGSLNEKQLRALKGIENSGRHLLELINDILDLSKIEAGKLDMRLEACSVADQCRASLQLVKGMANQKNQKIDFQMQPASITLRADARRLKQMLVNLLSNAIKFTPEGGELGLDVNLNEDEKTVIFSVWDEGIGIQPQELGTLFRPFVQLDSSLARQYTGTGLGLSLVKRMAELLGGSVRVESTPKLGSRFTIILPWSEDVTQPVPDLSEDSPDLLTWARNTAPLILMADDNEISLEIITGLLESTGCRVISARSGYELFERTPTIQPDIILVDIQMPGMDGMETIRLLRSHIDPAIASIPIIAVTALVMPGDRERCMAAGADEYVSKPIVFSKLIKLINRLLEQKKKS